MSDTSVVVIETDGGTTVVDLTPTLAVIDVDSVDAVTVIDVGSLGDAGPEGPPGDPGIEVGPTPPTDTDVLWADTTATGSGMYLGVDAASFGAVGDGVVDDTAALQAFLNAYPTRAHYLRAGTYRTTATLTIPDAAGYHLCGESRVNSVIQLDGNNMPILQTSGRYQHGYLLENFGLRFNTDQAPANTNAVGLLLRQTDMVNGSSWFRSTVRQMTVQGACRGVATGGSPGFYFPVWNCQFSGIVFDRTSRNLFDLRSPVAIGMPINHFSDISALNNTSTYQATDAAMRVEGEYIIDGLDVEDWAGVVISSLYGNGTIRNCHIERHASLAVDSIVFYLATGTYTLDQFNISFASAVAGGHVIISAESALVNVGSGAVDTTALTAAVGIALLRASGTTRFDVPLWPKHVGAANWDRYFYWEAAPSLLTTNTGSVTWDPASVAANAQTSTTVTVYGAAVGDPVAVGFSVAVPAGVVLGGSVTAADTVTVTLVNHTGSAVDLASGTLRARIWKAF